MTATTVYTVNITNYPETSCEYGWEPEGWAERVTELGWTIGTEFMWPNTNKVYLSRSSALKLKRLIESYGAKAEISVGHIIWRSETDAKIAKLESQIQKLKEAA